MRLEDRLLEISYKNKLSHLGSCLTSLKIIDAVYSVKNDYEKFILSNGHAALALYVVLEKYLGIDAEFLYRFSGTHPDRHTTMARCGSYIDCSTGSLGQGLPIAVGMALANRNRRVFCLISDGECSEGSIWEALRIAYENNLKNLKIIVNVNGYAAYKKVKGYELYDRFVSFGWNVDVVNDRVQDMKRWLSEKDTLRKIMFVRTEVDYPFLNGLDAHYHVMTEEEYNSL